MKTITMEREDVSLAQIERMANTGPVVFTRRGVPKFAVVKVDALGLEALTLGNDQAFMVMLAESWQEYQAKGGVTLDEARRILGIEKTPSRRRNVSRRTKPR